MAAVARADTVPVLLPSTLENNCGTCCVTRAVIHHDPVHKPETGGGSKLTPLAMITFCFESLPSSSRDKTIHLRIQARTLHRVGCGRQTGGTLILVRSCIA